MLNFSLIRDTILQGPVQCGNKRIVICLKKPNQKTGVVRCLPFGAQWFSRCNVYNSTSLIDLDTHFLQYKAADDKANQAV